MKPFVTGAGKEAGFTLLEILLVLIILALFAALAVPYLGNGFGGVKTKVAAGTIAATMKRARGLALRERSICTVSFVEGNKMVLGCANKKEKVQEIQLEKGVKVLSGNGLSVEFSPSGSSSGGNFKVNGPGSEKAYAIRVEPSTGHVRVKYIQVL